MIKMLNLLMALLVLITTFGVQGPQSVQPAQAATNTLLLSVISARTEPDAPGGPVAKGDPIPAYKYLINVDNTGDPMQARDAGCSPLNPGYPDSCDWPSIRAVPGAAPIFTQGDQDDFLSGINLPDGKYLVSVLADGYKIGGAHFTVPLADPGLVTVELHPHPLPSATMRIKVYVDVTPTNGAYDAPGENGLEGAKALIADVLGQVSVDVFGNPLCTAYDAAGEPLPADPTKPGDWCLISDVNGDIVVPNLGPNRYDVNVVPPVGYIQTSTLEGSHSWDTWLQEGGTGLDNEFVVAGEPFPWTSFGYAPVMDNLNNSTVTGGIRGTIVGAAVYVPWSGGVPYFGGAWGGLNGAKVTGPIQDAWVALADLQNGDNTVYVAPADPATGYFEINNVPDGNYFFTYWDYAQEYLLDWQQVTVAGGQITDLGTPFLTGWFTWFEGYVFNDSNSNGKKDAGEPGISDYLVVLKDRENTEIDRMTIAVTTDATGYYRFDRAYPMGSWMILEAYNDRYYTTGVTYQVENQLEETTVLGGGVDVGVLPTLGQTGRLDWGVRAYAPGTNGGIAGTVFYDTTRNELDARYQAVEGWAPGIPNVRVNVYKPVFCGTNLGAACDPSGMYELAADGSIAKNMTAGGVACGTTPGAACDASGSWELDASGNFVIGPVVNTALTEQWEHPIGCQPRNADGVAVYNDAFMPIDYMNERCLEAPQTGLQFQNGFASLDGNYGFGGVFTGFGTAADPVESTMTAGDYLVEVVVPADSLGKPMYQVVREEDINVFNGDSFVPQIPPPACAGPQHEVDLAGVGVDQNGTTVITTTLDGPAAVINPSFLDAGGTPFEGFDKPLCSTKLVTVSNGRSIAPSFTFFTEVPIPGKWKGYIIDDLSISTDPRDLMYGEKKGVPLSPIGIYDFTNQLVTTILSDPNGVFEVLLPSSYSINCPTPSGVCPGTYYMLGNDPGQPGAFNPTYNPQFRTIGATFEIWPGTVLPSDLAPTQMVVGVLAPGSTTTAPAACLINDPLNPTTPELFAISDPYFGEPQQANSFTIEGQGFGSLQGQVVLGGTAMNITSWTANAITFSVPAGMPAGAHQLKVIGANGEETVNGLTFHVLGAGYRPDLFLVGPGKTFDPASYTTYPGPIQAALDAASANNKDSLVIVYPNVPTVLVNPLGHYLENLLFYAPVKLQGVGPGGVRADGSTVRGSVIDGRGVTGEVPMGPGLPSYGDAWLTQVETGIAWDGNQAIYEGAVIYVLAETGEFTAAFAPAIDGFTIQGGDQQGFPNLLAPIDPTIKDVAAVQGGGIFANAYASYLQITNNLLQSNGGAYAGAIRLGTPHLAGAFNDNQNDFVRIANNRILANGGTNLAGAVGVFSGSEGYEIASNDICGNFSAEYGGGISHYGLSPDGSIHDNRILFNRSYDEAGGIMIAGELPADSFTLTTGAGAVDVYNNIIQANLGNDDGGGLRFLMAGNFPYNVYNNVIVNNVSTHEGAGISINDAPNVRIYNNTIMKNITTATAMTSNGQPAPAGLSTSLNSALLQATLPAGSPMYSLPVVFNNIFWDNRAGAFVPGLGVLGIGLSDVNGVPDATPIYYWDLGIQGLGALLAPTNSLLQTDLGAIADASNKVGVLANPMVISEYTTSVAVMPWRGNPNFVDTLLVAVDLPAGMLGDYHILPGSPARDMGASSKTVGALTVTAPAFDFENESRPALGKDAGADEYPGLNADLSISKSDGLTSVIPGMSVAYTIVVTNNGLATATNATVTDAFSPNLVNVTWTCVGVNATCGAASGAGNINTTVTLNPGGSATFIATGRLVGNPSGASLVNTASVTAGTDATDPNMANNSSTDTDSIDRRFPLTNLVDNFDRAITLTGLGPNWAGDTTRFHIGRRVAEVLGAGGSVRWTNAIDVNGQPLPTVFGANQEAWFSFSRVAKSANDQGLLLKFNDSSATPSVSNLTSSWVMAVYKQSTNTVEIREKVAGSAPVVVASFSASFNNKDGFGARALSNGMVLVYKQSGATGVWNLIGDGLTSLVGGGQIGVSFGAQVGAISNRAQFDNFGGGTLP